MVGKIVSWTSGRSSTFGLNRSGALLASATRKATISSRKTRLSTRRRLVSSSHQNLPNQVMADAGRA